VPAIVEGAFLHKDVLVRADVLERIANGWNLIEVKSGTKVKEGVHDCDVAVQVWVLQDAGGRTCENPAKPHPILQGLRGQVEAGMIVQHRQWLAVSRRGRKMAFQVHLPQVFR